MCEKNQIALKIINNKVDSYINFSYKDLVDEILSNGGVLRVAPSVTVRDYLQSLEKRDVIKRNPYDNSYIIFNGKLQAILEVK